MRKLTITVTFYCRDMGYAMDMWLKNTWLVDMGFCRALVCQRKDTIYPYMRQAEKSKRDILSHVLFPFKVDNLVYSVILKNCMFCIE